MGVEGGPSFGEGLEAFPRKDVERPGDRTPEAVDTPDFLAGIGITPEHIDGLMQTPLYEGASVEYVIWQTMLGRIVEGGAEMDPHTLQRLRNLTGVFGMVAFTNMHGREQEFRVDLVRQSGIGPGLVYEVTPEVDSDIRAIWGTFGLRVPQGAPSLSTHIDRMLPPGRS